MQIEWQREWPATPGYWWVWRPGDDRVYMRIVPLSAAGKTGTSPYFFAKVERPEPPVVEAPADAASVQARWG